MDITKLGKALRKINSIPIIGCPVLAGFKKLKEVGIILQIFSIVYLIGVIAVFAINPANTEYGPIVARLNLSILAINIFISIILFFYGRGAYTFDKFSQKILGTDGHSLMKKHFKKRLSLPLRLPDRTWPRIKVIFLGLMSLFFLVVGIILFFIGIFVLSGTDYPIYILIISGLFISGFYKLKDIVYRKTAIPGEKVLKNDKRKPVVFLRSFIDDSIMEKHENIFFSFLKAIRFEEKLTLFSWQFGPVVALGKKEEKLPLAGASREYIDDDHWQGKVEEMIEKSSLVYLIIGSTSGLIWETKTILEKENLHKLILVFPPIKKEQILIRWKSLKDTFQDFRRSNVFFDQLLNLDPNKTLIVGFDKNNKPIVIESKRKEFSYYEAAIASMMHVRESS